MCASGKPQPTQSLGYSGLHDKRVTFTETHNHVTCAWTALAGGAVFGNKASRHGYLAGVTQAYVLAMNERSELVFLVKQP